MTQHISYLVLGQRLHEPISSSAARHDYIQRRPFPRVFGYKGPSNPCCCIKPYRCKSPPVEAYEDCAARVDRGQCSAGGAVALARLQTRDYIESGCRTGVQDRSAKPLPSHASSPSWTNPSTSSGEPDGGGKFGVTTHQVKHSYTISGCLLPLRACRRRWRP